MVYADCSSALEFSEVCSVMFVVSSLEPGFIFSPRIVNRAEQDVQLLFLGTLVH